MRIRMISVVGGGGTLDPAQATVAEELGAALAKAGFGIVCGGLGGAMRAVARGARTVPFPPRPPIVGILPGYDFEAGNEFLDVVLPTGMGHARNALIAAAGDALVCVGGATGALSEVALARKIGRPVLAFPGTGGTAALAAKALKGVIAVETPEEAVRRLRETL
jgi:uncharacterized protein (TIGR00725 family)